MNSGPAARDHGWPAASDPVPWAAPASSTTADDTDARVPPISTDARVLNSTDARVPPTTTDARVLFTRLVTRANFAGFPFRASASPEVRDRLDARARAHAARYGFGPGVAAADLPVDVRGRLAERMLIPETAIASSPDGASEHGKGAAAGERPADGLTLFTGPDRLVHALAGGVEHWTMVRAFPGRAGDAALPYLTGECAVERDRDDAGNPVFSQSPEWGLLTSDPSWAGNGLQCEAGLHLPSLAATQEITLARRALGALGFGLEPLSPRDPGAAEAGYFRLFARGTLGLSRAAQFARFLEKADRLLQVEAAAWARWRAREPRLLDDRMHRALAVLRAARRLELSECLALSSYVRCGVYDGLFPAALLPVLETLRVRARPFHLADGAARGDDHEREPAARADLARALLGSS